MLEDITLYVYYKIPTAKRIQYLAAIKNLDESMKSHYPFLKISHQKRLELDTENRETWMETYAAIPNHALQKLKADLIQLAEKNGLPQERKYEIFEAI